MNFDAVECDKTHTYQAEVCCDVEWKVVNSAVRVDALLALSVLRVWLVDGVDTMAKLGKCTWLAVSRKLILKDENNLFP